MPYAGPSDASSTQTATVRASHHRRTRSSGNFSDERGPGAFAGLGHLPRLNKKAVFHINDNDDDNLDDNDRPSYPTSYATPYTPLNSLRLSMNVGKFSPSIQPPPRIDIPQFEPPTAVPFPTSSPSSPSTAHSPFNPRASWSTVSTRSSISLPRTPSTPIILSNGKPLKSSLKCSASSPNISDLPIKHLRAQSAPSTPSSAKNVHFAEKDQGLEMIRVFNRTGKPASLSKPPGDETETETEAESSSYPFPSLSTTPILSASSAALVHEIDPSAQRTSPVPKLNPSPYANVFLETLSLPKTRPPTLRGTILVRNVAFEKTVAVRFTLDEWQTTSEVMCKHVVSLPGLPPPFPRARTMGDVAGTIASGKPVEDEKESAAPSWDRFSFTVRLEDYEAKLADRTLYLVVRYNPGCGGEWWDNNDNSNYRVGFRRAAASPLPSPAIGVAHSQQRTFSAPTTLRTTPTTGKVSPFSPPTRQLAPAPPQISKSYSLPFPSNVASLAERAQREREGMSEKGLGIPTAAYLSKKLSLSNYVAPSAQVATPPITPPGTVRMRSASLPTDAGLSADEPKQVAPSDEKPEDKNTGASASATRPALTYRATIVHGHPATAVETARPPSPSASASTSSQPVLSPLSSIPGLTVSGLAKQAPLSGLSSYGYGFDGGSTLGYARPQLLSPPRSKESSPASSGHNSPRREGSPVRLGLSSLGLEVPKNVRMETKEDSDSESEDDDMEASEKEQGTSVTSLSQAVRDLGLNLSPSATLNANARVDTSDPSYAALLRQWCFAQSSPPAPAPSGGGASSASPSLQSPSPKPVGPVTMRSGETPSAQKVGFGHGAGYGFPGFSFGLPDAGMVGGECQ
ncbi:hypothetical protein C8Q74DRAFT_1191747 [Fomes fomentarius]|nr:hypothetical protein C8Q74DRAFT_1191747 [Fomes fomentarius]